MSVELRNTWKNIKDLYLVHWITKKMWMLAIIILGIFCAGTTILQGIRGSVGALEIGIIGAGSQVMLYCVVCIVAMSLVASDIVSAKNITMYPGTIKTRYVSRILYDYTVIAGGVLCNALIGMVGIGILKIIHIAGGPVGQIFFDVKTMVLRMTLFIAYMLVLYQVIQFVYVLIRKVGMVPMGCVIVALIVQSYICSNGTFMEVQQFVYNVFFKVGSGYGTIMVRLVIAFFVIGLLSYGMVDTFKSWKVDVNKSNMAFMLIIVYVVSMYSIFAGIGLYTEDTMDERVFWIENENNLEKDLEDGKVIVSDRVIYPGEVDADTLNRSYDETYQSFSATMSDAECSISWIEESDARKIGVIKENVEIERGSMLVRIVADASKYKDKFVYQDFINHLNFDIKNSNYMVDLPKTTTVYDAMFMSMDSIIGDKGVSIHWIDDTVTPEDMWNAFSTCLFVVVYNEEDIITSENTVNGTEDNENYDGEEYYDEEEDEGMIDNYDALHGNIPFYAYYEENENIEGE